jgi:hypothetical protein
MSVLVNRQPKPETRPVSGNCKWVVPIGKVSHTGVLEINGTVYTVTVLNLYGQLTGYRLEKLDGPTYDIDATAEQWRCDCPDATYHPERPGGCKHVAALRAALDAAAK